MVQLSLRGFGEGVVDLNWERDPQFDFVVKVVAGVYQFESEGY